ncbi:MAG: hypothetical protein GXN92_01990, partial [Candidatus Micrarchaeota archaeon]|nr:hypothetical protein [Candidatus Micrarchaeota archaeon]
MLLWLFLVAIASGAVYCDSCESCSNVTEEIILTQDIVASGDVCIDLKASKLDCNGHHIIGNNSSIGIYVPIDNTAISNCYVEGFQYGIYLNRSDNVYLTNNQVEGNEYGIYGEYADIYAFDNRVCFNNQWDFYSPTGWDTSNGTENQCDNADGWSDYGFPNECTYYCSIDDYQAPQVELIFP